MNTTTAPLTAVPAPAVVPKHHANFKGIRRWKRTSVPQFQLEGNGHRQAAWDLENAQIGLWRQKKVFPSMKLGAKALGSHIRASIRYGIASAKEDLGDGAWRYDAQGKRVFPRFGSKGYKMSRIQRAGAASTSTTTTTASTTMPPAAGPGGAPLHSGIPAATGTTAHAPITGNYSSGATSWNETAAAAAGVGSTEAIHSGITGVAPPKADPSAFSNPGNPLQPQLVRTGNSQVFDTKDVPVAGSVPGLMSAPVPPAMAGPAGNAVVPVSYVPV